MADPATVDVWNAASDSARQLITQGVSPNMLHAMQNLSDTMGKILRANMQHITPIVGCVGESMALSVISLAPRLLWTFLRCLSMDASARKICQMAVVAGLIV